MAQQLYDVLKPIRYKKPGAHYRQLISPGDEIAKGLSFNHLSEVDIALLVRTGTIAPSKAVAEVIKTAESDKATGQAQADAPKK